MHRHLVPVLKAPFAHPDCVDGETRAEALAKVEDAIATWIYCARKAGEPIPEPQLHRAV